MPLGLSITCLNAIARSAFNLSGARESSGDTSKLSLERVDCPVTVIAVTVIAVTVSPAAVSPASVTVTLGPQDCADIAAVPSFRRQQD